jgi:hypothetical protein
MHQAPWTQWLTTSLPSKRDRDKINSKASQPHPGANANTGASWLPEHQRKPKAIGNLAASFYCYRLGVTVEVL